MGCTVQCSKAFRASSHSGVREGYVLTGFLLEQLFIFVRHDISDLLRLREAVCIDLCFVLTGCIVRRHFCVPAHTSTVQTSTTSLCCVPAKIASKYMCCVLTKIASKLYKFFLQKYVHCQRQSSKMCMIRPNPHHQGADLFWAFLRISGIRVPDFVYISWCDWPLL